MTEEKTKSIVSGLWLRQGKFGPYYSVIMSKQDLQEAIDRCDGTHVSLKVNSVSEKKSEKSPDILLSFTAALSPEEFAAKKG